jgi:hypothetical protein
MTAGKPTDAVVSGTSSGAVRCAQATGPDSGVAAPLISCELPVRIRLRLADTQTR